MLKVLEIAFSAYPVTDIAKARAFYEGVLNLVPTSVFEHDGGHWIEYELGPHVLAIGNMSDEWKASRSGGAVGLEVEDFDATIAELKSQGVKFYAEPFASPVCRMAFVSDPDGNSIAIHKRNAGHH